MLGHNVVGTCFAIPPLPSGALCISYAVSCLAAPPLFLATPVILAFCAFQFSVAYFLLFSSLT